jgi:nitroreductase
MWQRNNTGMNTILWPKLLDHYTCGIVAQTLMLAAKSLGYDSCPMDGFDFEKVAQIISLPDDHVIAMFVAIGKGTKEAWPRPGQLSLNDVLVKNVFEQ